MKLTKEQKDALKKYEVVLASEDRYLGSVFVTRKGQDEYEAKTQEAYRECIALGMTYEHGL